MTPIIDRFYSKVAFSGQRFDSGSINPEGVLAIHAL
jgi:hypothetical protein